MMSRSQLENVWKGEGEFFIGISKCFLKVYKKNSIFGIMWVYFRVKKKIKLYLEGFVIEICNYVLEGI